MSAIGPGDFLECINDGPSPFGPVPLTIGHVYEVEGVYPGLPHGGIDRAWVDTALVLVGVPLLETPNGPLGYGAYRFRPASDPLADLLHRTPERVPA